MDNLIFQIPSVITNIKTMSQFLRLTIDTQETLSPESYKRLFLLHNKMGWMSFNVHQIEADDILNLPEIKKVEKRSPSQRLKAVLFILWKKDDMNMVFDDYYEWHMEKIIEGYKEKLT